MVSHNVQWRDGDRSRAISFPATKNDACFRAASRAAEEKAWINYRRINDESGGGCRNKEHSRHGKVKFLVGPWITGSHSLPSLLPELQSRFTFSGKTG